MWIWMTYLVFGARKTLADEFTFESHSFLDRKAIIVLRQAGLALLVHHQDKLDHDFDACTKRIDYGWLLRFKHE